MATGATLARLASSGRTFREIDREWLTSCPSETIFERRADGTLCARSPVRLWALPADKITERLEHWADRTPIGRFWQSVTPPACGST